MAEPKGAIQRWLGPKLLAWALRLIGLTGRSLWLGEEHLEALRSQGQNWIYCFWHRNVTQTAWALRGQGLAGLVSASEDGEMATRTIEALGNKTIRGSSSKGGARALLEMIRWVRSGKLAAITPDGPRGPALVLQAGAITLASKSGAPLVPFHMESTRQWIFHKSWDQHRLPKPFATKVMSFGAPIFVPPDLDEAQTEVWRSRVEGAMNQNLERVLAQIQALNPNPKGPVDEPKFTDPDEATQALEAMMAEQKKRLESAWSKLREEGKPNVPLFPNAQEEEDEKTP